MGRDVEREQRKKEKTASPQSPPPSHSPFTDPLALLLLPSTLAIVGFIVRVLAASLPCRFVRFLDIGCALRNCFLTLARLHPEPLFLSLVTADDWR